MADNFIENSKTQAFLDMNHNSLSELLSSDDLNVNTEEEVLDALLRWLEHVETRGEHITKLIKHIRVEHVRPEYIAQHMDIIKRFPQLQDLITMKFLHQHDPTVTSRQPRRRVSSEETFVVISHVGKQKPIYKYCPREDEWKQIMRADIEQNEFAICTVNDNELVIAGGRIDDKPTNAVMSINLRTKSFNALNPLNVSRMDVQLAVLNNCIYAIGGFSGEHNLKTVERLVQSDGIWSSWSNVADMREARINHVVRTFEGLIYVVGGYGLKSVECYNPEEDEWRTCAPMNEERVGHEVAVLNNYLYALGGLNGNTMERYDPRIDKWTQVCKLRSLRCFFACVALNGRLIIAGGTRECSVEEYNPEMNVWTIKKALPEGGTCVGALAKNI